MKKERDNQQWKKEWEEASVKWETANRKIDEEKKKSLGDCYGWNGVLFQTIHGIPPKNTLRSST